MSDLRRTRYTRNGDNLKLHGLPIVVIKDSFYNFRTYEGLILCLNDLCVHLKTDYESEIIYLSFYKEGDMSGVATNIQGDDLYRIEGTN